MQLDQRFTLPLVPEAVWPAFRDIALLVGCLPGAALTGPAVDGELPLRFDVRLGPIAAGFIGTGRVSHDEATRSGRFEGQAADKRTGSRIRGAAAFSLHAHEGGTRVDVTVDYTLTGALAQFSRGAIVKDLAEALTAQFAAQLAQRVQPLQPVAPPTPPTVAQGDNTVSAAPSASVPAPAPAPVAATASAPAAPLDGWALIKQMLLLRWRRLLGRGTTNAPR